MTHNITGTIHRVGDSTIEVAVTLNAADALTFHEGRHVTVGIGADRTEPPSWSWPYEAADYVLAVGCMMSTVLLGVILTCCSVLP